MWTAIAMMSYAALVIFSIMALISFIKKTKKVSQYLFFVGVSCVLIAFSLIIVPHMKSVQAKKADQASQKPLGAYGKSQLSVGDNGILNEDTFISLGEDKDDFNAMQAYITSNDLESLKRLVKLGKVYFAPQGTKIHLINMTFVRAKIEISSTGRIGFVPTVYLSKE
jgi:hypothetical protein